MKFILLFLFALPMVACNQVQPDHKMGPASQAAVVPIKAPANAGSRSAGEMVAEGFRRYGVESGIIEYRLKGSVVGTEVLYFDHWGWREAKYEQNTIVAGNLNQTTDKVQYLEGERRTVHDRKTGAVSFFDTPQVQRSAEKLGTKNMVEVGYDMMRKMGGVKTGTAPVAGVECGIWQMPRYNTNLWMYEGLTLQEVSNYENLPVTRQAVSARFNVAVPEEKLVLPKGLEGRKTAE